MSHRTPLEKQDTTSTLCIDPTFKVTLADADDPQRLSSFRKWVIVGIISSGTLCVTCASSMVRAARLRYALYANKSLGGVY